MSTGDLVAVVVTITAVVGMAILLVVLNQLIVVLRDLRAAADRLTKEAWPAVNDLRSTVDLADRELERLSDVIGSAEIVSKNLFSIGRKISKSAALPFIKAKSLLAGFRSGLSRLTK
jgi:Na+-transporting methylmalonyl-CoA/oxaloacetate decarboxylase gamma subunit|tara:strand:+ start:6219 stop:6569 length:351 start_codon:yes stop_codon:yes gene_type:complete